MAIGILIAQVSLSAFLCREIKFAAIKTLNFINFLMDRGVRNE